MLAIPELNRKLVQTETGKFILPNGLKIFWGKARPQIQLTLPRFTLHMSLFQRLLATQTTSLLALNLLGLERLKSGIKYSITILIQIAAHMSGAHIPEKHSIG